MLTRLVNSRDKMQQSKLESPEVQELKRLWWLLYNTLRVYDFLDETLIPAMDDIEILIQNLTA